MKTSRVASILAVEQFGPHLRSFREARHLTQAELGSLLGVKQARIADIESSPGSISVAQMVRLLSALGVEIVLRDKGSGWADGTAAGSAQSGAFQEPRPRPPRNDPAVASRSSAGPAIRAAPASTETTTSGRLAKKRPAGRPAEGKEALPQQPSTANNPTLEELSTGASAGRAKPTGAAPRPSASSASSRTPATTAAPTRAGKKARGVG